MDIITSQEISVDLFCPQPDDGINCSIVATSGSRSHVEFMFSLHQIVFEYYDDMLLTQTELPNIMIKSVHIDMEEQFMNSSQIINEELRDWPLRDCCRRNLSETVFDNAKTIVDMFMSPQHNVLIIPYRVIMVTRRPVLDENLAMELIAQRSMEESEDDPRMVPATDSSIESLKIRTIAEDGESCTICLEDFSVGCEVVSMPCSHVFHEDCIKKWLKSSHYCPICRFKMSTE